MATVGSGVECVFHSNNNNSENGKRRWTLFVNLTFTVWSFLTLTNNKIEVRAAAVYSNGDLLVHPIFEPLCAPQQERFIESDGKESSLLLEFNSKDVAEKSTSSCRRILSAPSAYGFIVRLILPKIRRHHHLHHQRQQQNKKQAAVSPSEAALGGGRISNRNKMAAAAAFDEMSSLIEELNGTTPQVKTPASSQVPLSLGRSCPLSVFSSVDPHTAQWRVDPCQLEDMAPEMEDPVRLFHGRLRIVWQHAQQQLDSKLMVTVLGKGDECRSSTKHQCMKIGDDPILCISKELVCDGIRHCPNSNEYDSDEDYAMCWRRHRFGEPMPVVGDELFEHFALEVFRNLFAFDVSRGGAKTASKNVRTTTTATAKGSANDIAKSTTTTLRKVNSRQMAEDELKESHSSNEEDGEQKEEAENSTEKDDDSDTGNTSNSTASEETIHDNAGASNQRNSTRMGLNSDLSKYGPWGYLMLGMLLCGGALLICGLWASATQHAANNEREANLQHGSAAANSSSGNEHTSHGAPPNYEELDPPPSYAALFPNQKSASTTTLNAVNNTTAIPTVDSQASSSNSGRVSNNATS